MNFGFTEEQELLRDQVRKFLDQQCPSEQVRKIMKTAEGYDTGMWQQMAELGWLGLIVDTDYDGVGLGWVDLTVVLEEMGRSLFPSPFISNTLAASTIAELGNEEQKKQLLPALSKGQKIATLALLDNPGNPLIDNITLSGEPTDTGIRLTGTKPFTPDAGTADIFLTACQVDGKLHLAIIDREQAGVDASNSPTMDETKRTGPLTLDKVEVDNTQLIALDETQLARIFDKGVVAVTAEMIGAAERATWMTSDYAKERIQFGQPIGKYQGVKHRLAEMYVDVESFKSLLYYAAWTVDESPDELPRSASLAKAYASDAFAQIGIDGVQLHGAIGFTQEYDIQLYLKRSKWARPAFGDSDFHFERVATIGAL
ncbi:MAG: acyl-CoA/acyl-ACP dehydrogenase [Pseudomonadales bacterium]|nr:acyl-CoA/acyl-ACP dehydrogenase [Pseudomonadales bacterium]